MTKLIESLLKKKNFPEYKYFSFERTRIFFSYDGSSIFRVSSNFALVVEPRIAYSFSPKHLHCLILSQTLVWLDRKLFLMDTQLNFGNFVASVSPVEGSSSD